MIVFVSSYSKGESLCASYHELVFAYSSVTQSCPTLCEPMNRSTPGLPVHHQLLEPTQTHVHWVGGAIQPSHPLSSSSPPALNLSQHHQGLILFIMYQHSSHKHFNIFFFMNEKTKAQKLRKWLMLSDVFWVSKLPVFSSSSSGFRTGVFCYCYCYIFI